MSETEHQPITSVPEFLAHALELEAESHARYRELAECMEVHNNPEVAELFGRMAHYSELHTHEVQRRAEGIELPAIAPWGFKWNCPESPEAPCMDDVNYLMNKRQALELALHNEIRGRDFYARVAEHSPSPDVRAVAREMADEEAEHVEVLTQWLARVAAGVGEIPEDLDPPNIPE
jgi:rubrerythrin